ncbi:MAG: oligopeptide transport system substrate-binding protein [Planctomycetota bacterium]|jgi:oligopeptide transport system substrate-binding protein
MGDSNGTSSKLPGARRLVPPLLAAVVILPVLKIAMGASLPPADFSFNNGTEVQGLDPATVTGVPEGRVMRALYEGLYIKHPRTLQPIPAAATSYEISEDGRTYTFHLRENSVWTNGDPVIAQDFEYSWERLLNPSTAAEYAYQLWYVTGAKQYTLLPSDYAYAPGDSGVWVREIEPGVIRLGLTGFALTESGVEGTLDLSGDVGTRVESGGLLLQRSGREFNFPISGKVRALNTEHSFVVKSLLDDPYENGWMIELEVDVDAYQSALANGSLIEGETYRKETIWPNEVGVHAEDDYTLVVKLDNPVAFFIQLTTFYPTFPINPRAMEAAKATWPDNWSTKWLRPEHIVTNGPFTLQERRINDRLRLAKNETYWDKDNVAFNTIDVFPIESYQTMLNLYLTGGVGWIDRVSTNQVPRLLPREDFNPIPYLGTYFFRVNTTKPPFDNPKIRRALALTIDRRAICEKIMKAGQKPSWSLVPPGLEGYATGEAMMRHTPVADDYSNYEESFAKDIAEAHALIEEAGFGPNGKDFPNFELHYNTSEAHRDIAEVVADSWKKNLDLDARLLNQEWKVYLDTQQNLGYDVSRSAWIGDYIDPNSFLDMFVTGNENNKTGWGNPEYDALVARAAAEFELAERMRLLSQAEAILMEELPILPIYFYTTQSIYNPRVGGFYNNPLDEHFPKHWYWMDNEELAKRRAAQPADWEIVLAPGPTEGLYAPAHQPGVWD